MLYTSTFELILKNMRDSDKIQLDIAGQWGSPANSTKKSIVFF